MTNKELQDILKTYPDDMLVLTYDGWVQEAGYSSTSVCRDTIKPDDLKSSFVYPDSLIAEMGLQRGVQADVLVIQSQ